MKKMSTLCALILLHYNFYWPLNVVAIFINMVSLSIFLKLQMHRNSFNNQHQVDNFQYVLDIRYISYLYFQIAIQYKSKTCMKYCIVGKRILHIFANIYDISSINVLPITKNF